MNPSNDEPNGGKTRWTVLIAYACLAAVTQLLWVTYTPITTASAESWGVSIDAVGWLAQVFPLLYVLLAVPFGYWADRRFKSSLSVGVAATVAGAVLRLLPGYEWALTGQIIISIGQPLILNAINKLAGQYAAPAKRPVAIAAGTASLFVGILISTVSSPYLMEWGGLLSIHLIQAVLAVIAGFALLWALRAPALYSDSDSTNAGITVFTSIRAVWAYPWVRLYSLLLFAGFGLFVTLTTWLEVLALPIGLDSTQVGLGIGGMTLAGIAGAAVIPGWAAAGGRARIALIASLLVSTAALTALELGASFPLFIGLFAITGCLLLANLPVILSSAEKRASLGEAGTVAGLLLMFGNLGGIVLTLAVQLLLDHRIAAIGLLIMVVLLAIPIAWRFPREKASSPLENSETLHRF
ncbi:MFS transporter [Paenibacillus gorillae]|uniref:MFS transporter n=1 Tax=Paenibacillus gorillae TaxID=1243662 RepID=UPI0004B6FBDE|nr:MFS transporter [Paenibacillus gorillae]